MILSFICITSSPNFLALCIEEGTALTPARIYPSIHICMYAKAKSDRTFSRIVVTGQQKMEDGIRILVFQFACIIDAVWAGF